MTQWKAEKIRWEDALYLTSHPLIDSQHQTIIDLYNALVELSLKETISSTEYARILFALDRQLHSHFSIEESVFIQHQHQLFERHHQRHMELASILSTHADSRDISTIDQLIQHLYHWFTNNLGDECRSTRQLIKG